ncbi:hypothetical protein NGF19_12155 [Streptomyces sp. RY43-2]|uniref:Uncharacterized protein n=1 Tax=Streptomyces macrolidinus TaxID=2952607 RepID=A0ABT0ZD80_9ACTN|nr:hypothetical protein [Streptomyces macrolidinus]MCN9241534.1 hypothetical protein [Streptomyces macrolidinus]
MCSDIDATQQLGNYELRSAVTNGGQTYVGIRTDTGEATGPFTWINLTSHPGYPGRDVVCSASINETNAFTGQPHPVHINVLTTTGLVYETTCTADPTGPTLTCDNNPWTELVSPTP